MKNRDFYIKNTYLVDVEKLAKEKKFVTLYLDRVVNHRQTQLTIDSLRAKGVGVLVIIEHVPSPDLGELDCTRSIV